MLSTGEYVEVQVLCIYLINQARGPYWENIGPRSWQYEPSAARSVQKRPRADILPGRSRASLVNKRFITRLKLFRRKTQMIDCKDTINFKRAIFIYSKLNVYSRLTFSKRRKTKLEENKNNILCGVNTFRKNIEVKLRENLRVGSFGTVPGPILREYWTGNGAIWLADFSYWPSELT